MKYKALIFDLDGTAIEMRREAMPNQIVIDAVKKAKKKVFVSIATGRDYSAAKNILNAFGIDKPCIVNGGSQLFDPSQMRAVWAQVIDGQASRQIVNLLQNVDCVLTSDKDDEEAHPRNYKLPQGITILYALNIDPKDITKVNDILKDVPGVSAHTAGSWVPGKQDIHITHELATKKHALQALLAKEKIAIHEVMVVGDSNNDLPLFELAGLKVAMGNGSEELKKQADWIAPTLGENGLAVAIEKYILETN